MLPWYINIHVESHKIRRNLKTNKFILNVFLTIHMTFYFWFSFSGLPCFKWFPKKKGMSESVNILCVFISSHVLKKLFSDNADDLSLYIYLYLTTYLLVCQFTSLASDSTFWFIFFWKLIFSCIFLIVIVFFVRQYVRIDYCESIHAFFCIRLIF